MSKWEDIVKDKLEGYESALPEGSLADFHALRAESASAPSAKRFPLVWAAALAVAAAFAAFYFLRRPASPEEGIRLIQQPTPQVAVVADSANVLEPVQAAPQIAQVARPKAVRPTAVKPQVVVELPEIPAEPATPDTSEEHPEPILTDAAPFIPEPVEVKPVKVHVGSGVIAAGGGLLAALATQLAGSSAGVFSLSDGHNTDNLSFYDAENHVYHPITNNVDNVDCKHWMPLRIGLSVRVPVSERLGITTGLDYSLYSSFFSSSVLVNDCLYSVDITQKVHYLGVPVRLDWSFVSLRWFQAYLGAGVKGDFCLNATQNGKSIGKDGPAFRLLGAGGVQFNATRHLGIYVEPEISWTPPSEKRVLATYSSEHPWMFSVASGIRITFGQK